MRVSSDVDERTLREIYFPAFERVVRDSDPATVMCSYNRINGTYASENQWLLTDVLRTEWGFRGAVVSDWGAVTNRTAALKAGLDLEMPGTDGATVAEIIAAVEGGALAGEYVDASAARIAALPSTTPRPRSTPTRTMPSHDGRPEHPSSCSAMKTTSSPLTQISTSRSWANSLKSLATRAAAAPTSTPPASTSPSTNSALPWAKGACTTRQVMVRPVRTLQPPWCGKRQWTWHDGPMSVSYSSVWKRKKNPKASTAPTLTFRLTTSHSSARSPQPARVPSSFSPTAVW